MVEHLDPVCGMTVNEASPHRARHAQTDYWFCGAGCRTRFLADPKSFLGEPRQVEAARWICPMDPDVESDRPGPCPKCGMALQPALPSADGQDSELKDMRRRFWISLPFSLAIMFLAMHEMVGMKLPVSARRLGLIQAALVVPVVVYCAAPIMHRTLLALRRAKANMFSLIALGVIAALALSVYSLSGGSPQHHGHPQLYFESAALIITLVLLGQWLEQRARRQTASALHGLMELVPLTAIRLVDDQEEEVPAGHVTPGDRLLIKAGGRVPVDGRLLSGHGSVDESALRGEFLPAEKSKGDQLFAGSINGPSPLIMEAEQVGEATLLSQIVQRVAEAQRSRAPIQGLADRVAEWFVPLVIIIAVIVLLTWGIAVEDAGWQKGFFAAISVLVIACPCALGLATPISVMVGMGRGARAGVLFRDAESLQRMSEVEVAVLDKTGTLSVGKARLSALLTPEGNDDDRLLAELAGLERASGHPLAEAFLSAAGQRGLKVPLATGVEVRPGRGIAGTVEAQRYVVGNELMMREASVDVSSLQDAVGALRREAQTALYVARAGVLVAAIGIEDPLRPEAAQLLDELRGLGLRVQLRSGDHADTVRKVAEQLGIGDWQANVLPEEKADTVANMRMQGHVVAMVGDGINDAPALAGADVGIALASGSDIAMQSASVVLVDGDLRAILRARRLSAATLANIRQNLAFAFGYNLIALPIAAGVLYPWLGMLLSPMIAAAAMSFSSLTVIGNALRLRALRLDQST